MFIKLCYKVAIHFIYYFQGFSKAEEEEAALLEEQEARAIQTRLIAELDDADISLGIVPAKVCEVQATYFQL